MPAQTGEWYHHDQGGRPATRAELASTVAGEGAALIGFQGGTTAQAKLDNLETRLATAESSLGLEAPTNSFEVKRARAVATANVANLAAFTVAHDGLTLVAGDRVLLTGQSTGAQNGLYVVGTVGGGTAPLTRVTDFAAALVAAPGQLFAVDAGTVGAGRIYRLSNTGTITVATTALTFDRLLNSTELASTANAKGASFIGIEDAASDYTATTVETALAEVKLIADAASVAADLAATTNGDGASLVGIEDVATIFTAANVEAALAEVKVIADADAAIRLTKRTVTVGHADLTEAVNGTAQSINLGATLPANARIAYIDAHTFTAFSGGGATSVDLDVGTTGDLDAIVDAADVFAAAVDGGPSELPYGIRPNKLFTSVGAQLLATFTPDGAHTLNDLTAGAITVDVYFFTNA